MISNINELIIHKTKEDFPFSSLVQTSRIDFVSLLEGRYLVTLNAQFSNTMNGRRFDVYVLKGNSYTACAISFSQNSKYQIQSSTDIIEISSLTTLGLQTYNEDYITPSFTYLDVKIIKLR